MRHTGRILVTALLGSLALANLAHADTATKLTICHFPPGNSSNYQQITIGAPALAAHLAHGDFAGPCANDCNLFGSICDDNNPCSTDTCNSDGTCSHSAVQGCCQTDQDCTTTDPCNPATCNTSTNQCETAPKQCDTGAQCVDGGCVTCPCSQDWETYLGFCDTNSCAYNLLTNPDGTVECEVQSPPGSPTATLHMNAYPFTLGFCATTTIGPWDPSADVSEDYLTDAQAQACALEVAALCH